MFLKELFSLTFLLEIVSSCLSGWLQQGVCPPSGTRTWLPAQASASCPPPCTTGRCAFLGAVPVVPARRVQVEEGRQSLCLRMSARVGRVLECSGFPLRRGRACTPDPGSASLSLSFPRT